MHVRPTIFDVERITGFSTGTISRAFNEGSIIKKSTRELVLKTAREIGYAPHSGARAMIQGRTRRWGLLLPHLENPLYAEVMNYLDLEARQRSTVLLLGLSRYDAKVEAELALHWASGEVDGIISDSYVDSTIFEQLKLRHFPLVFLFGLPTPQFNCVTIDTSAACATLMKRFLKMGHRRIGYVSHLYSGMHLHHSYVAYQHELAAHHLALDESLIHFGTTNSVAGAEAWQRWRHQSNRPTAVMCFNDLIACNLMQSALDDGYHIPEDLSVVGSDDIPAATFYKLTTIRANRADFAREVFALLERPHSRTGEVRSLPETIVERQSLGPVPSSIKKRATDR